jgi:hypothetical protein
MKRFFVHLTCAVAAVFALGVATPALACDNCDECPKHKAAAAGKKADGEKADKRDAAKPAEKTAPTAPAASPAPEIKKAEGGTKCECGPGGKGCICKKGECKCANCGAAKLSAAGDEKPKCECEKGKECICKGECKCGQGTKKAS